MIVDDEKNDFISLQGTVNKIIFTNKETGFTVAIFSGKEGTAIMSGNLPGVLADDEIMVEGCWVEHPKYGRQFKVNSYMKILPTEIDAIEAYLASGMIKGLGPSTAKKIVKAFGTETLNILSNEPHRLMEIQGIGEKKCEAIARSWKEQMAVTDIMVFLSGCGVTPAYAAKIYRKYGLDSISVIQENPYQLSYDIDGIGFLVADRIARKTGYPENSPHRIKAGTLYALQEGRKDGHVYLPEGTLKNRALELLGAKGGYLINEALNGLLNEKRIIVEEVAGCRHIYTSSLYVHEATSALTIMELSRAFSLFTNEMKDVNEQIEKAERKFNVKLSPEQRSAVIKACTNTVSILTGGPGTGKTLTTRVIVEIFENKHAAILLGAPTGKAAKRLESCGREAKTIHRLLEYSPKLGGFQRNDEDPLECEVLIIDETSMADISLFYHLLQAVPYGAHLIIIGDADQLPSVGPGLVMRHLVADAILPITVLGQIFRQEEGSGIVQIAHKINKGEIPKQTDFGKDCVFLQQEDPIKAVDKVVEVVTKLRNEGVDVQVISPMHKGEAGTTRLNEILQNTLNPIPPGEEDTYQIVSGFRKFRINDKVIQMKNDYEKEVFNGDSGVVESIDIEEQQLMVCFEGRGSVVYDFLDLDQLALSYAITVHKSQGSEYHTIIVMCMNQHYIMLARNLLYTAVSRAKKRAIIIGAPKAMNIAIRNDKQKARYTRLKERLVFNQGIRNAG